MKKVLSLQFLVLATSLFCFAQTTVKGKVYAFKDFPLNNIKVSSKKTKAVVFTDSLGNFDISIANKDKLIFEGNGFRPEILKVKNNDFVNMKMIIEKGEINRKKAFENGHISEEKIDEGFAKYIEYNNNYSNYMDIYSLIQSEFTGIQFFIGESGNKQFIIGGASSLTMSISGIYVVNGVIVDDISYILPRVVKTIDLVRNATMYGTRGSNGVIIITTIR